MQQIPQPPIEFYYTLTLLFAGALIYIIKIYISRIDATLKQLSENQQSMKLILASHEEKHKQIEKEGAENKANPVMAEFQNTLDRLNQTLGILNSNYKLEEPRGRRR